LEAFEGNLTPSMANTTHRDEGSGCWRLERQQALATDQALAIEQGQHLGKYRGYGFARTTDEVCEGGEVRLGIAGQGNEQHVVAARPLDRTRTHHALRVRQQHGLEQHRRCMGRRAGLIIAVARIECRQIQLIDQMVHGMGKRSRHQLRLQVHRQQPRTHVDVSVACHAGSTCSRGAIEARSAEVFLQPR